MQSPWAHVKKIGPIEYENRKSTGTKFVRVRVYDSDSGREKEVDVFFSATEMGATPNDPVYGVEIYQGSNYIDDRGHRDRRSYSRAYQKGKGLSKKWYPIVKELWAVMMKHVKTKHPKLQLG